MENVTAIRVLLTCVVLLIAVVAGLLAALLGGDGLSPSRRAGRAGMAFVLTLPVEGVVLGIAGFSVN